MPIITYVREGTLGVYLFVRWIEGRTVRVDCLYFMPHVEMGREGLGP